MIPCCGAADEPSSLPCSSLDVPHERDEERTASTWTVAWQNRSRNKQTHAVEPAGHYVKYDIMPRDIGLYREQNQ